jgi:hypothetical protein
MRKLNEEHRESLVKRANGLPFSCRERAAQDHLKKDPISRAKRSVATAGSVALRMAL